MDIRPLFLPMLLVVVGLLPSPYAYSADLSEQDIKEIRQVEKRLADGTVPPLPGYTLNHAGTKAGIEELRQVGFPSGPDDLEAVARKAGGWAQYKANVASLLKSEDHTVRGFAAIWLADLGDQAYSKELVELLQSPRTGGQTGLFEDWERYCVANAIGILGDRKYSSELAKLLKDQSSYLRAGAAEGLGWMHANDHRAEIAALLDDEREDVVCAAMGALAMLGEKQYAGRIAKIATREGPGSFEALLPLSALVVLGAKEQAPEIAKLLQRKDDPLARGQAILALAALGCGDYAKEFAAMLDDRAVRDDAMLALGILKETQYADKIAVFLHASPASAVAKQPDGQERRDRQAAAWSLIVMESKEHAAEAIDVYNAFDQEQSGVLGNIPPDAVRSLRKRFDDSLARLKKSR